MVMSMTPEEEERDRIIKELEAARDRLKELAK